MKVGLHPFFRNYFHLGANENKRFNSFSLGQKRLNHVDNVKIIQKVRKANKISPFIDVFYLLSIFKKDLPEHFPTNYLISGLFLKFKVFYTFSLFKWESN